MIAANVPLYRMVSKDYIPTNVDEGEFEVSVTAPEGATLRTMQSTLEAVEAELRQVQGITTMLSTIGSSGMSDAELRLHLCAAHRHGRRACFPSGGSGVKRGPANRGPRFAGNFSQREKMQEIRQRLSKFPDLRVAVRNQTSLRQGAPVDIDFAITGPDLDQLADLHGDAAAKVRAAAENTRSGQLAGQRTRSAPDAHPRSYIPGLVDTDTTLRLNKPELLVEIDRERAASLGIDVAEIAQTLRVAIGGDDRVSRYRDPALDDVYDVELRLVGFDRKSQEDIAQLYVRTRTPQESRRAADREEPRRVSRCCPTG